MSMNCTLRSTVHAAQSAARPNPSAARRCRLTRRAAAPCIALLAAALVGCQTPTDNAAQPQPGAPAPAATVPATPVSPQIDAINLTLAPVPMNLDDQPGADGLQASVYFFQTTQPLSVALQQGVLEVVMYEGQVPRTQIGQAEPTQVWRFPAAQLNAYGFKSAYGPAYKLTLLWHGSPPESSSITLTARIPRPGQPPLYAAPITMATKPG